MWETASRLGTGTVGGRRWARHGAGTVVGMSGEDKLPAAVKAAVADVLQQLFSGTQIVNIFSEADAPGERPVGANKTEMSRVWLTRAEREGIHFAVLGKVLEHVMEVDLDAMYNSEPWVETQKRLTAILGKYGLTYHQGGKVIGGAVRAPTRSLEKFLREGNLTEIERDFDRALESVDKDPPDALTAACTIIETYCRVYIEDRPTLTMPKKQDLASVWAIVRADLKLDPGSKEDDDIRAILGGLGAVAAGIGAFRTHAGDAHGQGRNSYNVKPRHARLAIHAAHTLVTFLIETERDPAPPRRRGRAA
jgi:Abortive infection C-terminus